jgi:hypothetical protein
VHCLLPTSINLSDMENTESGTGERGPTDSRSREVESTRREVASLEVDSAGVGAKVQWRGGEVDGVELQEEEEDALSGRRCANEPVKNERAEVVFEYILCFRYRFESSIMRQ